MNPTTTAERRRLESLARVELERYQLQRLNALLNEVLPANSLYAQKFERLKRPVESLAEYAQWPFTFYEALTSRGALVIATGGMSSVQRLEMARQHSPTVVCCTPSYALHLAEVGAQNSIDVGTLGVRLLLLAGEPGGSIPAVREKLQSLWNATVHDHCGATETGAWGYGDPNGKGLHVIETEFIAEFLSLATGAAAQDGEEAELVITNLGRAGCPVFRYRTGDVMRPTWKFPGVNRFVMLNGGVLGRNDDMLVVRGVNVFPSSIDHILRSFPEIVEYRATVYKVSEMDRLRIEVEDRLEQPDRLAGEFHLRLGLR